MSASPTIPYSPTHIHIKLRPPEGQDPAVMLIELKLLGSEFAGTGAPSLMKKMLQLLRTLLSRESDQNEA